MREKGASKEGGQGQDRKCLSKLKQDHLNQALPKETISPHNYFSAWIPTIPCLPRWTTRCRGARRAGWLSKWGGPCPSHLVASVNIDALWHWSIIDAFMCIIQCIAQPTCEHWCSDVSVLTSIFQCLAQSMCCFSNIVAMECGYKPLLLVILFLCYAAKSASANILPICIL